jgi:hypothetical protein
MDGWRKVGQNLKQNMKVDDLTPEPQVSQIVTQTHPQVVVIGFKVRV